MPGPWGPEVPVPKLLGFFYRCRTTAITPAATVLPQEHRLLGRAPRQVCVNRRHNRLVGRHNRLVGRHNGSVGRHNGPECRHNRSPWVATTSRSVATTAAGTSQRGGRCDVPTMVVATAVSPCSKARPRGRCRFWAGGSSLAGVHASRSAILRTDLMAVIADQGCFTAARLLQRGVATRPTSSTSTAATPVQPPKLGPTRNRRSYGQVSVICTLTCIELGNISRKHLLEAEQDVFRSARSQVKRPRTPCPGRSRHSRRCIPRPIRSPLPVEGPQVARRTRA